MGYEQVFRDGILTLERRGDGSPVVILPGVMADADGWRPVGDAIDAPNPLVIINRRGREPSIDLGAGYGVGVEIDDLRNIVASIGEPVHLFGWSYGGLVALEAAVAGFPMRSLVAYEPVSRPFAPETIEPIRDALKRGCPDRAVEIVNRDVSGFSQDHVDSLRSTPAWPVLCRLALPLADELSAIDRFDPAYDRYASIEVRTTLLLGSVNEGQAPYGTAFDRFARAMPHASVQRLQGEGHLAHVDNPTALGRQIALHLAA